MSKDQEEVPRFLIRSAGGNGGKVCDLWCEVTPGHAPEIRTKL